MKTRGPVFLILLFICAALLAFINNHPYEELPLNSTVPMSDVKMKDVGGNPISLEQAKKPKGLLVVFSCNTCPYVVRMESRIREYSNLCLDKGIGCVIVNSNEAQRSEDDSFEAMQKYYREQQLKCFYTVDEKSAMANAFGASRTPQCFLFDASGKLTYKGAIDDNVKEAALVKVFYLRDAINAVLSGQAPAVRETKSIGCTIKRLE